MSNECAHTCHNIISMSEKERENCTSKQDDKFYTDAETYWRTIKPTMDGMLGGFAKISPADIDGSRAFLRPFLKISGGQANANRALDCGSGIGRITKRLLLPMFETVDMVDVNPHFLEQATSFVGEESKRIGKFICSGLQNFTPEQCQYDIIWCQWVLGHLIDDDLVAFFRRCKKGLTPNGLICVKDNMASGNKKDFDEEDSCYTRPLAEENQLLPHKLLFPISSKGSFICTFPDKTYQAFDEPVIEHRLEQKIAQTAVGSSIDE